MRGMRQGSAWEFENFGYLDICTCGGWGNARPGNWKTWSSGYFSSSDVSLLLTWRRQLVEVSHFGLCTLVPLTRTWTYFHFSSHYFFGPGYVFVPSNISSGFGVDVVKSWEIRMQKMFHHFWFQSMPLRWLNRLTRVKPKNATNVCCMLLTRLTFFAPLFLSAVLRLCTLYRPTHIPPSGSIFSLVFSLLRLSFLSGG